MVEPLSASLNVSFHFPGLPLDEALDGAVAAGFHTIELLDPYAVPLADLERALRMRGLRLDLFNLPMGDFAAGDRGIAADPARRDEFRAGVEAATAIGERLGATKVNALGGRRLPDVDESTQLDCLVEQVGWAAERLADVGVRVNTELLNPIESPGLLLRDLDMVISAIDSLGGRVGLQLDIYHLQRAQGELIPTIRSTASVTGHVQIADAPDRTEPGSGEIAYVNVLDEIRASGYSGLIGCEFRPSGRVSDPFGWMASMELAKA